MPEGYAGALIVGGQYSLWPNFAMRWMRLLERMMSEIALRAEMGMPDRLLRLMLDGVLDIAVMYTPQLRPGLEVEVLMEDSLVLAASTPDYGRELDSSYLFVDWGPEFTQAHKTHFGTFRASHVTMALGTLAARYVIEHKRAAYFPARFIEDEVEQGTLHIIPDAPVFPFPVYAVWNVESDPEIIVGALGLLRRVAGRVEEDQSEMLEQAGVEAAPAARLIDILEGTGGE